MGYSQIEGQRDVRTCKMLNKGCAMYVLLKMVSNKENTISQ